MVEPVRHRQTKGAETDMFEPKATASHLDSTLLLLALLRHADRHDQRPLPVEDRKTSTPVSISHFDPGCVKTTLNDMILL
jgi:hypothetical protein